MPVRRGWLCNLRCRDCHAAVKRTRKDLQTDSESLQDPMADGQRQGLERWVSDTTTCIESGGIRIYFPGLPWCPVVKSALRMDLRTRGGGRVS